MSQNIRIECIEWTDSKNTVLMNNPIIDVTTKIKAGYVKNGKYNTSKNYIMNS